MERSEKRFLKEIIEWDTVNWGKALEYWDHKVDLGEPGLSCLELGAGKGGLSLWLALKGNDVVCSDVISPEPQAAARHARYSYPGTITYGAVDATNIPYRNHFDIVIFKSILGGISRGGRDGLKKQVVDEIYKALKPGGKLLFAENLSATFVHRFFRIHFVRWGGEWNYLRYDEILPLFSCFSKVDYTTAGFLALLGRNENQRCFLGKIDERITLVIPQKFRYVVIGVAEK